MRRNTIRNTKKKKGGGFGRGLLLFLFGATCGMGGAAALTAYTNKLHLPFIEPPTRAPGVSGEQLRRQSEEEALQFREVLRNRQPQPAEFLPAEEESDASSLPDAAAGGGSVFYYLQVGAFREQAAAENARGEILLSGRQAIIKTAQTADEKTLYRVWVGPYADESLAEAERAEMLLSGYKNIQLLRTTER